MTNVYDSTPPLMILCVLRNPSLINGQVLFRNVLIWGRFPNVFFFPGDQLSAIYCASRMVTVALLEMMIIVQVGGKMDSC